MDYETKLQIRRAVQDLIIESKIFEGEEWKLRFKKYLDRTKPNEFGFKVEK